MTDEEFMKRSLTVCRSNIVPVISLIFLPFQERNSQNLHHPVQQSMSDLKSGFSVHVDCTKPPVVPSLPFLGGVLDGNVGNFENLHGQRQSLVFTSGFKHTGQEGSTDDLVLEGLWVGKVDSVVTRIRTVEPGEVFVVRALQSIGKAILFIVLKLTNIKGKASIQPAIAHSFLIISPNLFTGNA